jgi:hypothetical protein
MKKYYLPLFVIFFGLISGCVTGRTGSTYSDDEWMTALHEYKVACHEWELTLPPHLIKNTEEEKAMPEWRFRVERCKADPVTCNPPHKPQKLVEMESSWGKKFTPDSCPFKLEDY